MITREQEERLLKQAEKLEKRLEEAAPLTTKKRKGLPDSAFAFPRLRKLPINDAAHCRAAISRFNSTTGWTAAEKRTAFRKILRAAKKFGIDTTGFRDAHKGLA